MRITLSQARIVSGVVLLAFATTHLINHAAGIISLDAVNAVHGSIIGFWHREPANLFLLLALIVHIVTSLIGMMRRRTVRMPVWQMFQLTSGFIIPFLLIKHILGTSFVEGVHGVQVNYFFVLPLIWPSLAEQQIALSLLVWLHGVLGFHYWLRQRAWYRNAKLYFLGLAVFLPTVSIAGFVSSGREVRAMLASDPSLSTQWAERFHWVPLSDLAWTLDAERIFVLGFSALLLGLAVWRLVRDGITRLRNGIVVRFEEGTRVRVPPGTTVLEASALAGLPHAAVCGGRGRCSTCRVRVKVPGGSAVQPPSAAESRVLNRLGAMADVRLACQLRPERSVDVIRLMSPGVKPSDALKPMDPAQGYERSVVILFADLRDFTRTTERRLPYDVVYLLNRYFDVMGNAIERHHGYVDKFIGDGIMAIFGITSNAKAAARDSLAAAAAMGRALTQLNEELAEDLKAPLRMGIGLHLGPAIVGEMGYGQTVSLTAVGDTVNTASRLEATTKELGCELVASSAVVRTSGLDLPDGNPHTVNIRGRKSALNVVAWASAAALAIADNQPAKVPLVTRLSNIVGMGRGA